MRGIAVLIAGMAWAFPETWLIIGLAFIALTAALGIWAVASARDAESWAQRQGNERG